MKVIKIVVDEIPCCCGGKPAKDNPKFHPNPCDGLAFGADTWCIYTGETIPDTNIRPDWCPLVKQSPDNLD